MRPLSITRCIIKMLKIRKMCKWYFFVFTLIRVELNVTVYAVYQIKPTHNTWSVNLMSGIYERKMENIFSPWCRKMLPTVRVLMFHNLFWSGFIRQFSTIWKARWLAYLRLPSPFLNWASFIDILNKHTTVGL